MSLHEIYQPGQRVPIRAWARRLDDATVRQLRALASMPYVTEHVAAMADAHVASGVAVGSVFATEHVVVPGALGGDLGCGMTALRVASRQVERRVLEKLLIQLERAIPTGAAVHRARVEAPSHLFDEPLSTSALEHTRAALVGRHLGTLGGGNHFVELDRDAQGGMWLLVHSGSRGLGAAIAAHHAKIASAALAGLDTRAEGADYLCDLEWALSFARENRRALLARACAVLADVAGLDPGAGVDAFDVHHNFVARETWFGRQLLVHRKGAVCARAGSLVLVPGSMGTASYVVRGLGCEAAFGSCSHGAGRVLSRSAARARVRHDALKKAMHDVVYPVHLGRSLVEEAPVAYRDIDRVLEDQRDLVTPVVRLRPIMVLKG